MFDNSGLYPSLEEQRREEAMKRAVQETLDQEAKKRARQAAELADFRERRRAPKPARGGDK